MKRILIFAGTTEGRVLSEGIAKAGIPHTVCVATEYGELVMQPDEKVTVNKGRMDEAEMTGFISGNFDLVYDATHPYAEVVTQNIIKACEAAGAEYVRVLREDKTSEKPGTGRLCYFEDTKACADALNETEGNILLTTGSKELAVFAETIENKDRIFARVLPSEESLKLCTEAGLFGKQIIAMHGPFSKELNEAMIKGLDIRCLVTKQSGMMGGYYDKLEAAKETGVKTFVIGKPLEEDGVSVNEILSIYGQSQPLHISLIGYGPGKADLITVRAQDAIKKAEVIFGSKRLIEDFSGVEKYPYFYAKDVIRVLEEKNYGNVAVLFSGDCGFFSGASKMAAELRAWAEATKQNYTLEVVPGISSLSYLSSRLEEPYQEYPWLSLHGRNGITFMDNLIREVKKQEKVYLIMSGAEDVRKIGAELEAAGLSDCTVKLGRELSYPQEEIQILSVKECQSVEKEGLYAAVIENPAPENKRVLPLLRDEDLEREAGTPMTKEMIRHASLIRMNLSRNDVLYDVGSGTGSVSIEAARLDPSITVYAIEKKDDAFELTKKNAAKYDCHNIQFVKGEAPAAFAKLEAPTHVFIGGSGGNLREIISAIKAKNHQARFVINAISLETIAELNAIIKEFDTENLQIEQISVSKSRTLGNYHLLTAENPIMIFSFNLK